MADFLKVLLLLVFGEKREEGRRVEEGGRWKKGGRREVERGGRRVEEGDMKHGWGMYVRAGRDGKEGRENKRRRIIMISSKLLQQINDVFFLISFRIVNLISSKFHFLSLTKEKRYWLKLQLRKGNLIAEIIVRLEVLKVFSMIFRRSFKVHHPCNINTSRTF